MLKQNFLTGSYVYFSEERLNRPINLPKSAPVDDDISNCPFCSRNSHLTPPPVYNDGIIKIVPNLYPFISQKEGLGFHDVVIDTPNHFENISDYTPAHTYRLLRVLQMRFNELYAYNHIKYVQIFKNNGLSAGASQPHSHWQIGAQTIIPPKIVYMLSVLQKYYTENNSCYFDSAAGYLNLWQNDMFKISIPTDALFPYETHIIPKNNRASLTDFSDDELKSLANALLKQLNMYKNFDKSLAYNICFYSCPKSLSGIQGFRFFIQIIPRIGNMAGFEFSTGCYINSVPANSCKTILSALL